MNGIVMGEANDDKKYIFIPSQEEIKIPTQPKPSDYHDLLETNEERQERIYLYEVETNDEQ